MAIILSIETSAPVCSVAVHQDGVLLGCNEVAVSNSHSEVVTVLIETLLENLNIKLKDLDAVGLAQGPGSYTGLRIGASTAKGLCFSLDIPLVTVPTLSGLMSQVQDVWKSEEVLFCPMLDARRMEVYHAVYDQQGEVIQDTTPLIFEGEVLKEYIDQKLVYFGDGASKGQEFMSQYPKAIFVDGILTSARGLGKLAYQKFQSQTFEDVAYFEPFYLKEVRITTPKKKNV